MTWHFALIRRPALVFEGPGQGEAQYEFHIRGDYEVPVKAVIDYVKTRSDLDGKRIGMWGASASAAILRATRGGLREAHQGLLALGVNRRRGRRCRYWQ